MAYPWTNGYNPYYPVQAPPPAPQMQQSMPQPMQQMAQMQQPVPVCRPVTSLEEAKNTPVDFMGGLMVFPDVQNNRIYTKRWNANSGMAEFCEFAPAQQAMTEAQEDPVLVAIRQLNEKVDSLAVKMGGEVNE